MTVAGESGGGRYAIEASIAAAHAVAPTFADTDWVGIVGAYDRLPALRESPAVRINRAVAVSFRDGPDVGLRVVDELGTPARTGSSTWWRRFAPISCGGPGGRMRRPRCDHRLMFEGLTVG
ncbi:hypothetical protein GS887_28095 [Rhodococcus hoagii]|nr:hypothetical protein [Prescottella equi]